ncbi:hypothetical protein RCL1_005577 [Eukaryota sp. TZLM3-RCL]
MLALMTDKTIEHGPLEFLFTTDEEVGLIGAANITRDFFKSSCIVNLDEEDLGVCVGCCGGHRIDLLLPLSRTSTPQGFTALEVYLSNLFGGHSGADIHLNRGNAILLLARILNTIKRSLSTGDFLLGTFNGGSAHNAIPRSASAVVLIKNELVEQAKTQMNTIAEQIKAEYIGIEENITLSINQTSFSASVLDVSTTSKFLDAAVLMPNGVVRFDPVLKHLVETSQTNTIVSCKEDEEKAMFLISSRSSCGTQLQYLKIKLTAFADLVGMETTPPTQEYPPWVPKYDSIILQLTKEAYTEALGQDPHVSVVHGGLEPSMLVSLDENIEAISVGPLIRNPHTMGEYVDVPSVEKFWNLLQKMIAKWNVKHSA